MSIRVMHLKNFVMAFLYQNMGNANTTINNINTFYIEFFLQSYCINSFLISRRSTYLPQNSRPEDNQRYMT